MCVPLPSEIVFLGYQTFRCPGRTQLLVEHIKMQPLRVFLQENRPENAVKRFSQTKGTIEYGRCFIHPTHVFSRQTLRLIVRKRIRMPAPCQQIEIIAQLLIANRQFTGRRNSPGSDRIDEIKTEPARDQIHGTGGPAFEQSGHFFVTSNSTLTSYMV